MAINRQNYPSPERTTGKLFPCILWILLIMAGAGCVGHGNLYTRVVQPGSLDFRNTPTGTKVCRVSEHEFKEPLTGAGLSVSLSWRILEETARQAGITNLYYADVETFSILNGIYKKETLILYGD